MQSKAPAFAGSNFTGLMELYQDHTHMLRSGQLRDENALSDLQKRAQSVPTAPINTTRTNLNACICWVKLRRLDEAVP